MEASCGALSLKAYRLRQFQTSHVVHVLNKRYTSELEQMHQCKCAENLADWETKQKVEILVGWREEGIPAWSAANSTAA